MTDDGKVFRTWGDLVDHFGGEDALAEEIREACDYDYPEVEFDHRGDGPTIVLQAPLAEFSPAETIVFPITEKAFWRQVADLNQHLTEIVEVIDLPVVEPDEYGQYAIALVKELAERLHISSDRVLNTVGGGWISCDELIADQHRGTKKWFCVGDPVLAVIGIGRQETIICEVDVIPAGMMSPGRLEIGWSIEVDTEDLFDTDINDGAAFLAETITKARKRLRLCKGCRQLYRYVSDYQTDDGTIKGLCERCYGWHFDVVINA